MKRMLLTGAGGFLGWNICRLASREWEIYGTVFSHRIEIPGVKVFPADLRDSGALTRLMDAIQPHAVIHTAAISDVNFCQERPLESRRINVDAAATLARLCGERDISCLFTSSDLVFDGKNAPYGEDDPVSPLNVYGEQKVRAEEEMLKVCPRVIICRMPLMFGEAGPVARSFLQPMMEAMKNRRPLRLFTDELRTPLSADDAVRGLLLALARAEGILHLAGTERISRYDFGVLAREVFRFSMKDAPLIPCLQKDVDTPAPRPSDVSLKISKALRLGFNPTPLRDALIALRPLVSG